MVIGMTDNMGAEHKLQLYNDWILTGNPSLTIKRLSYALDNLAEAKACDGIVMTGGGDVDPALYGGESDHPKLERVDLKRDDFERSVIDAAMTHEIPFLAICRGIQITNVHLGGTLIQDLPEEGYTTHSSENDVEARHDLTITPDSLLAVTSNTTKGNVNSYHHQAAAIPGRGLVVVARSHDGIVEGMELEDRSAHPFFLLIQWHPERMKDRDNPFAKKILIQYLTAAQQHSRKRQ